jgi:hypothetical protein
MLLGTGLHLKTLGPRPGGKRVIVYDGARRSGNDWKAFKAKNDDAEILTAPEWELVERIHAALVADPVAQQFLWNAQFEVPLTWDEGGLLCSTSGIDIVVNSMIGDLKLTSSTQPEEWCRHAFKMNYPQQLAFYRRGARANGIDTSKGLFLLGIEAKEPFEVVALELTENMIDFADRCVSLWLGKLRTYKDSNQFPGYAQRPLPFELPNYLDDEDDEEEEADDEEAAA